MANAYVEMDAKKYVQFMKESMAAKARAQNFKKARFTEAGEPEAVSAMAQFAQTLYNLLGRVVGMGKDANPETLGKIGEQIGTNIGTNFDSLKNFVTNCQTGAGNFFRTLGSRVVEWIGKLGAGVNNAAEWMKETSTITLNGAPLTKGTLVALAVLAAVVLIGGYKFFKGLANKSDQQNNNNQNNNNQNNNNQNQNVQTNNMQTNNAQPTESILYDAELQSYLIEGDKLTGEIMDILTEQTELKEGIFDMFTWLGKMVRKAAGLVKEMFGYVGKFIKQHPIVALLVLVCIFFVLFCTPGLTTILGDMGVAGFVQKVG